MKIRPENPNCHNFKKKNARGPKASFTVAGYKHSPRNRYRPAKLNQAT